MSTTRPPVLRRKVRLRKVRTKPNCEQALHACEEAATRIRCAGEELAACWSALCREMAAGVSATTLLRTRAMCNVLELRLKEHAHLLEDARHGVDAVWEQVMLATRARELFNRVLLKGASLRVESGWPLLAHSASGPAAPHPGPTPLKK